MSKNLKRTLYVGLAALMIGGIASGPSINAATNPQGTPSVSQQSNANQPTAQKQANSSNSGKAQSQTISIAQIKANAAKAKQGIKNVKTFEKNYAKYHKIVKNNLSQIPKELSQLKHEEPIAKAKNRAVYQKIKQAITQYSNVLQNDQRAVKSAKLAPQALKEYRAYLKQVSPFISASQKSKSTHNGQQNVSQSKQAPMSAKTHQKSQRAIKSDKRRVRQLRRRSHNLYHKGYTNGYTHESKILSRRIKRIEKRIAKRQKQMAKQSSHRKHQYKYTPSHFRYHSTEWGNPVKHSLNAGKSKWWQNPHYVMTAHRTRAYHISDKGVAEANDYIIGSKMIPKGQIIKGHFSPTTPGGFGITKGTGLNQSRYSWWNINPAVANSKSFSKHPYSTKWIARVK